MGWWYAAVTLLVTADITTADSRDFPPKCVLRWEWSVFGVRHVPWLLPVSQIKSDVFFRVQSSDPVYA